MEELAFLYLLMLHYAPWRDILPLLKRPEFHWVLAPATFKAASIKYSALLINISAISNQLSRITVCRTNEDKMCKWIC